MAHPSSGGPVSDTFVTRTMTGDAFVPVDLERMADASFEFFALVPVPRDEVRKLQAKREAAHMRAEMERLQQLLSRAEAVLRE